MGSRQRARLERHATPASARGDRRIAGGQSAHASEQLETAAIQQALAASRFGFKVTPQVTTGRDPYALTQRTLGVAVSRRLPFGTEVQATANTYAYGTSPNAVRDAGYGFTVTQPLLRGFGPAMKAELVSAPHRENGTAAAHYTGR